MHGLLMSPGTSFAPVDATAFFNKREGKQIKAAISATTGAQATRPQYDCMSK